jgi:hypothetical protein
MLRALLREAMRWVGHAPGTDAALLSEKINRALEDDRE